MQVTLHKLTYFLFLTNVKDPLKSVLLTLATVTGVCRKHAKLTQANVSLALTPVTTAICQMQIKCRNPHTNHLQKEAEWNINL